MILWAIVMIFVLPLVARLLGLPTGVAGAWIGTSEFADAAGLAAAQAYGGFAGHVAGITRHGRSGHLRVHADEGRRPRCLDRHLGLRAGDRRDHALGEHRSWTASRTPAQIWWRFPKFVIGFLLASLLITYVTALRLIRDYYKTSFTADLVAS